MAEGLVLTESRSLVRRELIYYLKVTDRQSGEELGRVGDIHTEGMLVLTPAPLPEQTVYKVFVELPKVMANAEGYTEMPIDAQALWSRPGPKASNFYETGFRFLHPPGQALKIIKRLTEFFAMPG
jgi:hypothetical protein